MEEISFSQQVKEEITSHQYSEERKRAILSSFIKMNGALRLNSDGETISFSSENAKTIRFLYTCLNDIYGINSKISYLKNMNYKKKTHYEIILNNSAMDIASDLYINFFDGKISKHIAFNDDTIGGYLAGAFLAKGSVNSPKSTNYHLEIKVTNENYAKWLLKLINKYDEGVFNAKMIKRREGYVLYLKKSDQISSFLILIGATQSCLYFENIRVDRDELNNENRLNNIYDANIKKTMKAAELQLEDIEYIDKHFGISNLPNEKEKLVALYRKKNISLSLSDISDALSDDLGVMVSKSNIAHIFRKLHEFAKKLGK